MLIADTPTLGLLIGLPIAVLLVLACVVVAVLGFTSNDYDGPKLGWGSTLCALAVVIGASLALWPFKHDYHFWVEKEGTVTAISKRLVPAGDKGMQEKIVVTLGGQPYGITDTRAALVKRGDWLSLGCKKAYEWGSPNHGWDCRWRDHRAAR